MIRIVFFQARGIKEVSLDANVQVGNLIRVVTPASAGIPDTEEDHEVFLLDDDKELSKDAQLKDHKAFVIHRCKKILVTVVYPGLPAYSHKYSPATLLKHTRKDAIEKFNLDGAAAQNLELFENQDQNSKVNRNYPIGFYSDYPTCSIQLYLSDPNA